MFDDFSNQCSSGTSGLSFFINKMNSDDLIGLEIGVSSAACACVLLQSCPTIKRLDLVDSYKPHYDFIETENSFFEKRKYRKYHNLYVYEEDMLDVFSGLSGEEVHNLFVQNEKNLTPENSVEFSEDFVESAFERARHNLYSSGFANKTKLYVMTSDQFLEKVPDNHYDFIFFDSHLSYSHLFTDLEKWIPKIKDGGMVSGHDYYTLSTWWAVRNFRELYNIEDKIYRCYNDSFVWFKNVKNGIMELGK